MHGTHPEIKIQITVIRKKKYFKQSSAFVGNPYPQNSVIRTLFFLSSFDCRVTPSYSLLYLRSVFVLQWKESLLLESLTQRPKPQSREICLVF